MLIFPTPIVVVVVIVKQLDGHLQNLQQEPELNEEVVPEPTSDTEDEQDYDEEEVEEDEEQAYSIFESETEGDTTEGETDAEDGDKNRLANQSSWQIPDICRKLFLNNMNW